MLVNNNYSNCEIDAEIKTALENYIRSKPNGNNKETQKITLFYKNTMTTAYKEDERILKEIINKNVTPKTDDSIELRIYYKNRRTSNLIVRNNTHKNTLLQKTNVVYRWTCPDEDCKLRDKPVDYIGHTTTTLSRRMTMTLHAHPPYEHTKDKHQREITRKDLIDNVEVLQHERRRKRLQILEAVLIRERFPTLNTQRDYLGIFTLCSTSYGAG